MNLFSKSMIRAAIMMNHIANGGSVLFLCLEGPRNPGPMKMRILKKAKPGDNAVKYEDMIIDIPPEKKEQD